MSTKRIAATVVALAALMSALAGANAAALDIAVSPGGAATSTSTGPLTFTTSLFTARCDATMTSTINRRISGTAGSEFATVTGARLTNCTGGAAVAVLTGSAPKLRIHEVLPQVPIVDPYGILYMLSMNVSATVAGLACLYGGDIPVLQSLDIISLLLKWKIYGLTSTETIPKVSGGALCPATMRIQGTMGAPSPAQTVTVI